MIIREAIIDDVKALKKLCSQLGYDASEEVIRSNLINLQKKPYSKVYVSSENEYVIGYISFEKYETLYIQPGINITGLVVDTNYRGKGIGSELLKVAEQYANKHNLIFVRANSGIERESAHVFYRKNLYLNEKEQKRFIKIIS